MESRKGWSDLSTSDRKAPIRYDWVDQKRRYGNLYTRAISAAKRAGDQSGPSDRESMNKGNRICT